MLAPFRTFPVSIGNRRQTRAVVLYSYCENQTGGPESGSEVNVMFENIGEMLVLFWRTLTALPLTLRQRQKVFEQFFEIGNASLLMVCILSFFIGGETALQAGPFLADRGLAGYLGGIVGYSTCRELVPILMAVLIA